MYVKLFGRMLRSSIMDEDVLTRWSFVVMLLSADREGMVYGTIGALARAANLAESDFTTALDRLMAPDANSTTPDEDGRRVVMESPNCWRVVNYAHYREAKDEEGLRLATRERVRRYREKKCNAFPLQTVTDRYGNVTVTPCNAVKRSVTPSDAATDPCSDATSEASARIILSPSETLAPSPRKTRTPKQQKLYLDCSSWEWIGITDTTRDGWRQDYPAIDIDIELGKARGWVRGDPTRKKTNWQKFLAGWFSRAQDKGGGIQHLPAVDYRVKEQAAQKAWQSVVRIGNAGLSGDALEAALSMVSDRSVDALKQWGRNTNITIESIGRMDYNQQEVIHRAFVTAWIASEVEEETL